MMKYLLNFLKRGDKITWFGLLLHLVFIYAIYLKYGILEDKEAQKYLGCAEDVLSGNFVDFFGVYKLYTGYILFLLPFKWIDFLQGVIIIQLLLNVIAAFQIRTVLDKFGENEHIGNLFMIVYLLAFPIHQWGLSYYSEGLFIPLVTIFTCRSLLDSTKKHKIFLLAIAVILTRPTGVLFVLPILFLSSLPNWKKIVPMLIMPIIFLFAPILPQAQLEGIAENHVILGKPQKLQVELPDDTKNLYQIQRFVIQNDGFVYWLKLTSKRVVSLFNPTRPWFSQTHNIMVSFLFLLYVPVIVSAIIGKKYHSKLQFLSWILVLNAILISLTYDEWDARFYASILPVILLLSGFGALTLTSYWVNRMVHLKRPL